MRDRDPAVGMLMAPRNVPDHGPFRYFGCNQRLRVMVVRHTLRRIHIDDSSVHAAPFLVSSRPLTGWSTTSVGRDETQSQGRE